MRNSYKRSQDEEDVDYTDKIDLDIFLGFSKLTIDGYLKITNFTKVDTEQDLAIKSGCGIT
jgi:hypothetical protein